MIPGVPFPLTTALKISRPFYSLAGRARSLFPGTDVKIKQSELPVSSTEYISIAIFSSVFWSTLSFFAFGLVSLKILGSTLAAVRLSLLISFVVGIMSFFYIMVYPSVIISRKVREIDRNLLFALRHLLIQIKSGVTLYDALSSLSKGNYGAVSKEVEKAVSKISAGKSVSESLDELGMNNPSLYFRRAIWQISNSVKSGSDLGSSIESLVKSLSEEQRILIKRYGAQLSPLALMYMMVAVIFPTLGITLLIAVSSFTGLQLPESVFYLVLASTALMQFMLIGMVKNRRPSMDL